MSGVLLLIQVVKLAADAERLVANYCYNGEFLLSRNSFFDQR